MNLKCNVSKDKGIFNAKGADIYFETEGKGENLLFIHAGIADRRMWDREFITMSKYFKTIRIDLPGYGLSDFTGGEYSYNDILNGVLKHLRVEKTYIIAASFGGRIALDFVLSNQDKCQGMVLMAPAVSGWDDSQYLLDYYEKRYTAARRIRNDTSNRADGEFTTIQWHTKLNPVAEYVCRTHGGGCIAVVLTD